MNMVVLNHRALMQVRGKKVQKHKTFNTTVTAEAAEPWISLAV